MIYLSNKERIEANREKLFAWADEGKSYYWMARTIGIGERGTGAVSHWFLAQGIRRKAER